MIIQKHDAKNLFFTRCKISKSAKKNELHDRNKKIKKPGASWYTKSRRTITLQRRLALG